MSEQPYTATVTEAGHAWVATLPDVGEVRVDDPRFADHRLREMLGGQLGLHGHEQREDLELRLVDAEGEQVFGFLLLFNSYGTERPPEAYQQIRDDPPAGCRWHDSHYHAGLYCLRRGATRLEAIASVVAEVRERYGLGSELNDLGFEKLWEWYGSPERGGDLVAHLLLMAVHRAELVGLSPEELVA
ncbi:MAG: hypothetical protein JWL58_5659, partial [Streptosporangiaceae bacterium]|nr:hypothetical protein [Streptosporangiaceae bacterium]